ncbi:hypothetical protein MMC25_000681 [Agyrium rufum]|nr:hypothetical protein [Agyrium rufum]
MSYFNQQFDYLSSNFPDYSGSLQVMIIDPDFDNEQNIDTLLYSYDISTQSAYVVQQDAITPAPTEHDTITESAQAVQQEVAIPAPVEQYCQQSEDMDFNTDTFKAQANDDQVSHDWRQRDSLPADPGFNQAHAQLEIAIGLSLTSLGPSEDPILGQSSAQDGHASVTGSSSDWTLVESPTTPEDLMSGQSSAHEGHTPATEPSLEFVMDDSLTTSEDLPPGQSLAQKSHTPVTESPEDWNMVNHFPALGYPMPGQSLAQEGLAPITGLSQEWSIFVKPSTIFPQTMESGTSMLDAFADDPMAFPSKATTESLVDKTIDSYNPVKYGTAKSKALMNVTTVTRVRDFLLHKRAMGEAQAAGDKTKGRPLSAFSESPAELASWTEKFILAGPDDELWRIGCETKTGTTDITGETDPEQRQCKAIAQANAKKANSAMGPPPQDDCEYVVARESLHRLMVWAHGQAGKNGIGHGGRDPTANVFRHNSLYAPPKAFITTWIQSCPQCNGSKNKNYGPRPKNDETGTFAVAAAAAFSCSSAPPRVSQPTAPCASRPSAVNTNLRKTRGGRVTKTTKTKKG